MNPDLARRTRFLESSENIPKNQTMMPFEFNERDRSPQSLKGNTATFSWPFFLVFDLLLLALLILGTRLATGLHECLGHALMVLISGGTIRGIHISLLGGGHVYYSFVTETGLTARFLIAFGGIMINLITGLLCLHLVPKLNKRPIWQLFFILFSLVSVLGALAYTALGFYYVEGDPVSWLKNPVAHIEWLSLPVLLFLPFMSFKAIKIYAWLIAQRFPSKTVMDRLVAAILTIGLAGTVYTGLYALTGQQSAALDTPALAYERAEEEVRKIKKEALFKRYQAARPDLSEEEIRQRVEQTTIVIDPEEIPKKFPLKPIIAVLSGMGAFLALWHHSREDPIETGPPFNPRSVTVVVFFAIFVLLVLGWTRGWIYRN